MYGIDDSVRSGNIVQRWKTQKISAGVEFLPRRKDCGKRKEVSSFPLPSQSPLDSRRTKFAKETFTARLVPRGIRPDLEIYFHAIAIVKSYKSYRRRQRTETEVERYKTDGYSDVDSAQA